MRRIVAIVILAGLPLYAAPADIYRSVDAQGHLQYSDTPSPGAVLVSATDAQSADSSSESKSAADDSDNADANGGDAVHQRLMQQAAARAVQKDTAQLQAQQCKQAQDAYEKSIEARKLYRVGKDGVREYLNDDEAEQERVSDRLAMQAACKNASS
ncbi:MAG TPA: DUF4124 domain-containing protein [Steroidobacteraceae bacterium]|jgi:hypothetical protein|nr:DUF4124 domain-containing protein [Steroidobacteraceae bacterium]